jgi:hypothetical protein
MLVRKFRVYFMRKGERHYESLGERAVSVSDDRRDAWLDVDDIEVHAAVKNAEAALIASRPDIIRDIYLHEQ